MKKMIMAGLIIVCSIVIVASFFAPWARAKVSVTKVATGLADSAKSGLKDTPFAGKFVKKLDMVTKRMGDLGDIEVKTEVSGYDIPTLVNKKSSKIALSLAQALFKDAENLDKKSMLVYLLPLFGLICAALAVAGLKQKIAVMAAVVIAAVISGAGLYNLMTMKMENLAVQISIGNGLWQTIYAYLLIAALGIVWLIIDRPGGRYEGKRT